jgi:hypothetical protein
MKHPFAVPARLSADLERVRAYWRGLLRGGAEMPFGDDVSLPALPDLTDRLLLIDAFEKPQRFRLATVGEGMGGVALEGGFLDEAKPAWPLEFMLAQCSATVESASPTWFEFQADADGGDGKSYARLLLPLWGDGRISMILGVVAFE